jgi:hypothetical protein
MGVVPGGSFFAGEFPGSVGSAEAVRLRKPPARIPKEAAPATHAFRREKVSTIFSPKIHVKIIQI